MVEARDCLAANLKLSENMPKFTFEITIEAPSCNCVEKDKFGEEAFAKDWLWQTFHQAQLMRRKHISNHIAYIDNNADENTPFIKAQEAAIEQIEEWVKTIKFVRKE